MANAQLRDSSTWNYLSRKGVKFEVQTNVRVHFCRELECLTYLYQDIFKTWHVLWAELWIDSVVNDAISCRIQWDSITITRSHIPITNCSQPHLHTGGVIPLFHSVSKSLPAWEKYIWSHTRKVGSPANPLTSDTQPFGPLKGGHFDT